MRVVLLLGASSTGKSTLCRGVANSGWKVNESDAFGRDCVKQAVEAFSEKYDIRGLLSELKMSTDEIANFASTGKFQAGDSFSHQFENPELTDAEQVLDKLAIPSDRIPALVAQLHTLVSNREKLEFPEPSIEFLNRFFNKVFSEAFASDDTLIIDVNPHPAVGPAVISRLFDQNIERYREKMELSVESFKVLAYCPPEILSERIQRRAQGKKAGDYMGQGIYPFEQVAMLVNSQRIEDKSDSIGELSRRSIFDIASKHVNFDKSDPLISLDGSDSTSMSATEIPLTAPKPVVEAYLSLADKFGFVGNEARIKLCVSRENFQCDLIIDTSKQNPSDLMTEIDRIAQERQHVSITPKM